MSQKVPGLPKSNMTNDRGQQAAAAKPRRVSFLQHPFSCLLPKLCRHNQQQLYQPGTMLMYLPLCAAMLCLWGVNDLKASYQKSIMLRCEQSYEL